MASTTLVHNGGYVASTVTLSNSGTVYTPTITNYGAITNTGAIYTAGTITTLPNCNTGITLATYQPATAITLTGSNSETLLTIHKDGTVEWTGPLSKNADAFVNAVGYSIDKNAAGEQAMAKSYRKAIERCLRQIKTMSKEDFIAALEQEVETRMSKAVWQELSKNDEAADV